MEANSEQFEQFCKVWTDGNRNRQYTKSTPDAPHEYQLSWYGINLCELLLLSHEPCVRISCLDTTPYSLVHGTNGTAELGKMIGITDMLEDVISMWPSYHVSGNTIELMIRDRRYADITFSTCINYWMDNSDNASFESSTTDEKIFYKYSLYMQKRMDEIILQGDLNILKKFTHLS